MIKIFTIFLFFLNTSNYIFAGAPALNEDPIPPAPYSLTKTNHLIIGVEWDKKSIEKFLPPELSNQPLITGGINIFNSRKKQLFYPVSGGYAWIDVPNNDKNEKFILFSIYGLNKSLNNVMNKVYNLNSEMGSNKVTLINNNATANTSVRKKNILSLSASASKDCAKAQGVDYLITKITDKIKTVQQLEWITQFQCKVEPTKISLKGNYESYKVKKMLWAYTLKDAEIIIKDKFNK